MKERATKAEAQFAALQSKCASVDELREAKNLAEAEAAKWRKKAELGAYAIGSDSGPWVCVCVRAHANMIGRTNDVSLSRATQQSTNGGYGSSSPEGRPITCGSWALSKELADNTT